MIRQHLSTETEPHRRGFAFGQSNAAAVRNTVACYERLFDEVYGLPIAELEVIGSKVRNHLEATETNSLAEICGIANGAAIPEERLIALNARTEVFTRLGVPECSVVGVSATRSSADLMLAQNWDWHPDAYRSLVLWTVATPAGEWFATLTEAGMLAKIGLNGSGLAVCINRLVSSLNAAARSSRWRNCSSARNSLRPPRSRWRWRDRPKASRRLRYHPTVLA